MSEAVVCPKCESEYTYEDGEMMVCTQCFYEWNPVQLAEELESANNVYDSNGNVLQDGDSVIVIKDLPVKGESKPIKAGTKVKNIRLVDEADGHNIACKIDGFGSMVLKSEFVRKG